MLAGLPADARTRFERLRARCLEMRGIAAGVRGAAGDHTGTAEDSETPGPRPAAVALPPAAALAGRARSLSADDERAASSSRELAELRKSLRSRADGRRRAHRPLAAGQHRRGGAAARQLRARAEERRVRVGRARPHRRQDPGAHRNGGQPPGSRLPQQPDRLGGREHAADREGHQRAAAPHRPRRPARRSRRRFSTPICGRCCGNDA